MLSINNTHGIAQRKKSGVVQSVIFSIALGVGTTLSNQSSADGILEKDIHIPDLTREEVVVGAGLLALGTAANTQGGGLHIEIPPEEICKNLTFCIMYLLLIASEKK